MSGSAAFAIRYIFSFLKLTKNEILQGYCYPKHVILQAVYLKLRFTLTYRNVEEIMKIRGVIVDYATIQRWVDKFTSLLDSEMKKRKGRVGAGRRLDEAYIKVKVFGVIYIRAVDKLGN